MCKPIINKAEWIKSGFNKYFWVDFGHVTKNLARTAKKKYLN